MSAPNWKVHTAASVDIEYDLLNKTATFSFHTEGSDHLKVTTPLHELERLYKNIDAQCREGSLPFAPVRVE